MNKYLVLQEYSKRIITGIDIDVQIDVRSVNNKLLSSTTYIVYDVCFKRKPPFLVNG